MNDRERDIDTESEGWFSDWRASAPPVQVLTTALILICAGSLAYLTPRIDGALFPVFEGNDIVQSSVSREGQRLCWTRVGLKRRALPLEDVDAVIDYISNKTGKLAHQVSPALRSGETGDDLTSDDAVPAGVAFERRICTTLSMHILPGQPIRLRQIAHYRSWTGLYNIPVEFPTIILPADAAWIFSKHDTAPTPESSAVAGPKTAAPSRRSDAETLDDVKRAMAEMRRVAPPEAVQGIDTDDPAPQRGPVHMDTTLSIDNAARVEQSRQAHGDRSRRDALRRLIPRGLDAEDRDALGPYDPAPP